MIKYKTNVYLNNKLANPRLKLIINHHAGGNAAFYFKFIEYFPKDWEVYFIDLPNRAYQTLEEPLKNRTDLYRYFSDIFCDFNGDSIALFGHSLGGHISVELLNFMQEKLQITPKWLGISSKNPPNKNASIKSIINYTDPELIQWLEKMNGTPKELLENKEILELFLPCIKNDLQLYFSLNETFESFKKFSLPLSVFYGTADPSINPEKIKEWQNLTTHSCHFSSYAGDHFYFNQNQTIFMQDLISNIEKHI